ncbi:MAG: hypothetical protein ACWA44_12075 [Thiotrichales bacterium]
MLKLIITLLISLPVLAAGEITTGSSLPTLTLKDQFDEPHTIGADTRRIIFASDKHSSRLVNDFLSTQSDNYLELHQTHYLADISGMPKIISSMFALPKMREYRYQILLADQPETLEAIPRRSGEVTLISLADNKVTKITYAESSADLKRFLSEADQ